LSNKVGMLLVIAAPSGAGKTSLVKALIESESDVQVAISHTTRSPRAEENSGINYFFVSQSEFEKMSEQGAFIEHANVFGNLYGTSKAEVRRILDSGHHLILEIDWQGAEQIRNSTKATISIFILPPSLESLRLRLMERAQDDKETIEYRMAAAMDEISHYHEFDYLIINDDFDIALTQMKDILHGRGSKLTLDAQRERLKDLVQELIPT
jgi:guanylate kinase